MENGQKINEIALSQQQWSNSLQSPGYNRPEAASHPLMHASRLALQELSTIRSRMDSTVMSCLGPTLTAGQLGRDLGTTEPSYPATPWLLASREGQGKR